VRRTRSVRGAWAVEEGAEPVEEEANANMEVDDVDARCRGWRGHHGELVWTMEEPVTRRWHGQ
jgi:hypothetical protein